MRSTRRATYAVLLCLITALWGNGLSQDTPQLTFAVEERQLFLLPTGLLGNESSYPRLAESLEVSEDGLTYTITLRSGMTFSDGTPVTATSIVTNLERLAELDSERFMPFLSNVDSVEAVDDQTLQIQVTQPPTNPFTELPEIVLLDPDAVAGEVEDFDSNCPVDEFSVPGQDFHTGGSTGGLTLNPTGAVTPNGSSLTPFAEEAVETVAILIVDDFADDNFSIEPAVLTSSDSLEAMIDSPDFSHGALVMNHLNALILNTGMYQLSTIDSINLKFGDAPLIVWDHMNNPDYKIIILPVNTMRFDTNLIADRIRNAIQAVIRSPDIPVSRLAVNMSFSIIPCVFLRDFEASDLDTFEDYVNALADINGAQDFVDELLRLILTPFGSDPLLDYVDNLNEENIPGGSVAVFVAASGNFRLPYQLYPAAMDEVVGVSASNAHDPGNRDMEFSNVGEVMDIGAWFALTDPLGVGVATGTGLSYAGTSFSAPYFTLFSALDLARSTVECSPIPMDIPSSDLAHHGFVGPSDTDVLLDDAINNFCPLR